MHVAKYWRNKKLRYQLIRNARRPANEATTDQSKTPDEITSELQQRAAKRTKAVA